MMNSKLIYEKFRSQREYVSLITALNTPRSRRCEPVSAAGLSDGALPVFIKACYDDCAEKKALVILPDDKSASLLCDRLSADGARAVLFPARDYNFNNMTASHDYEHERLSVLYELCREDAELCVVTTPDALLQITMPPELMKKSSFTIEPGAEVSLDRIIEQLALSGYIRTSLVEGSGQFAVRGDIIDVFPPGAPPVRIELFGNEIDRIGTFDPVTQRFAERITTPLVLPPVREVLLTDETRDLLHAVITKQRARAQKSGAVHVAGILSSELSEIEAGFDVTFADKYLPHIYQGSCLLDYFSGLLIVCDAQKCRERAEASSSLLSQSITDMLESGELSVPKSALYMQTWERLYDALPDMPSVFAESFTRSLPGVRISSAFSFGTRHVPSYKGNFQLFIEDLTAYMNDNFTLAVLCSSGIECRNMQKLLSDRGVTAALEEDKTSGFEQRSVYLSTGADEAGFELYSVKFALLNFSASAADTLRARKIKKAKQKKNTEKILSYSDLDVGDFVVHAAYGIGIYMGVESLTVDGTTRDYVSIKYAGTDKLFLPVDQLDNVSKYIGAASDTGGVKLSKMGGADWTRAKAKASEATREMARELIELYARRQRTEGIAFEPDDDMSRQFAASFEYTETDSQTVAIDEVRRDMEAPHPMDRILCGDVGYGKTEVALRAAFKAVMSGRQVAFLVPTTILAYQHFQTAQSRLRGFPVSVDMLSRFRTPRDQAASLRKLRRGETDIIIGTHRIISKDVEFHNLGLIIVDEEQRFGVAQKEKLKQFAVNADVLTLTATPIPRTLNMAMGGILDMSLLDDVPGLRSPVQTYVMEHDDAILNEAMRRELRRGGQVFYLINRIESLYTTAARITRALPDARIAVAHGRLERDELEEIWSSLVDGEIDILVSTTIIETGIDIPNANTLIIEHADRYGLSQLHQIRGRVGRSSRRAYAYFTYTPYKSLSEVADKRLRAIKEYAAFGAGFKIALRDLEIRGAGDLLGSAQHGHLDAVGYDMYIKLMNEAVLEEKGEAPEAVKECVVNVKADAYISKSYIKSMPQRMEMYKKIARIENEDDYRDIIDELSDRFGDVPKPTVDLCRISLLRSAAQSAGIVKIEERNGEYFITDSQFTPSVVTAVAAAYPAVSVRMLLSSAPAAVFKPRKAHDALNFMIALVMSFKEEKKREGQNQNE